MMGGRTRILYGARSSIIVDVIETCRRLGVEVVAIIDNLTAAPAHETFAAGSVTLDELGEAFLRHPVSIPLFTPGYRQIAAQEAQAQGAVDFPPLLDPTAILPTALECGRGVYVNAGVTIGGASRLKEFSFINRSASLGHHATVGAFASIGPGVTAGGCVSVGRGAVVGVGAVLYPEISVGENAVIAPGAVVSRDVPDCCMVAGNPARIVRKAGAGYRGMRV